MIPNVPVQSIAFMSVNAIIVTLIPIVAFIIINKKTNCKQNCVLVGAGTFVVFALVLETLLHQLVFHFYQKELTENIYLYALYGGLAAGLFEETGRFISMKLFMKKALSKENSLMYGVGHGGAEAIIVGAMTAYSNIVLSVMININQIDSLLSTVPDTQKDAVIEQFSALSTTPGYEFLLAAAERFFAFILQICLSYIIYRAVRYKKPLFFVLAVAIHFAVDAGTVILSKNIPAYLVEVILAVTVICTAFITFGRYKAEKEEDLMTENGISS